MSQQASVAPATNCWSRLLPAEGKNFQGNGNRRGSHRKSVVECPAIVASVARRTADNKLLGSGSREARPQPQDATGCESEGPRCWIIKRRRVC